MTGTLAQIIALATHGNHYLQGGSLPPDFESTNIAFQFCGRIGFLEWRNRLFSSKPEARIVADGPSAWFEYLRAGGCRHLRLYYVKPGEQEAAPDHQLAAFIGGGGDWLIEAVYAGYSQYWANSWDMPDQQADDENVWSVSYVTLAGKQETSTLQVDLRQAKDKLRQTLHEIAAFAYQQDLRSWGGIFEDARAILDSDSPDGDQPGGLMPRGAYSLVARQLLCAASAAWVFGGMGSWNDLGFAGEKDNVYNRLSGELYAGINESIVGAVNGGTFNRNRQVN